MSGDMRYDAITRAASVAESPRNVEFDDIWTIMRHVACLTAQSQVLVRLTKDDDQASLSICKVWISNDLAYLVWHEDDNVHDNEVQEVPLTDIVHICEELLVSDNDTEAEDRHIVLSLRMRDDLSTIGLIFESSELRKSWREGLRFLTTQSTQNAVASASTSSTFMNVIQNLVSGQAAAFGGDGRHGNSREQATPTVEPNQPASRSLGDDTRDRTITDLLRENKRLRRTVRAGRHTVRVLHNTIRRLSTGYDGSGGEDSHADNGGNCSDADSTVVEVVQTRRRMTPSARSHRLRCESASGCDSGSSLGGAEEDETHVVRPGGRLDNDEYGMTDGSDMQAFAKRMRVLEGAVTAAVAVVNAAARDQNRTTSSPVRPRGSYNSYSSRGDVVTLVSPDPRVSSERNGTRNAAGEDYRSSHTKPSRSKKRSGNSSRWVSGSSGPSSSKRTSATRATKESRSRR
eukprot:TRINITY_DN50872_c0_g1_i1.p1 TRINITY_DN50872_c0_g1~~TRINITY_DN50872_c0_g1_i1.p1  ORF type:complete len:479 (+),score=63.49 TRINITY_DN50872_c0_g1_i1:62-1438(+)